MHARLQTSANMSERLHRFLGSVGFRNVFLVQVGQAARIENPAGRPAEHFVELPLANLAPGSGREFGIILVVTTVVYYEHHLQCHREVLSAMERVITEAIKGFLPRGDRVQVVCRIVPDGTAPVDATLVLPAFWVEGESVEASDHPSDALLHDG